MGKKKAKKAAVAGPQPVPQPTPKKGAQKSAVAGPSVPQCAAQSKGKKAVAATPQPVPSAASSKQAKTTAPAGPSVPPATAKNQGKKAAPAAVPLTNPRAIAKNKGKTAEGAVPQPASQALSKKQAEAAAAITPPVARPAEQKGKKEASGSQPARQAATKQKGESPSIRSSKPTPTPQTTAREVYENAVVTRPGPSRTECSSLSIRCAENVALLSSLDLLPGLHTPETTEGDVRDDGVERSLPLRLERDLSGILAFLASTTDNPDRIMAVCVEETPCGQGVKVLIAVNTLAPESGHVVLRLVQNSFNRIFQILQRFRSDSYNNIENDVFEEIINLCQKRILNRMRSKKSPVRHDKKAECYLGELFGDFVDALRRQGNRDLAFQMHIDEAQSVLDILEEFEHDSNPQDTLEKRVANVVQKIQHFMEDVNLGRLLETAKGISQESRSTILDSMRKIARYREAARFLYRRAKKYPILQNAHATQVRLDASVFPQSPEGYLPDLTSAIVRFEEQGCHVSNAIAVKRLRKKPAAKNRQFSDKVFEGVKHAKIHAEIQILAHYELHPVQRPPRYIASNMDACYLCWTFIRLHGKFHVRKSHGSLHTRWKLPVVATLRPVQEQLNAALEEDIIHGIKQPVLAKSRGFVQKSTVFSVILSATTLSGSGIAGSDPVTVGRSEKVVTIEERVPETSNDKSAEDVLPHDIPTQDSEVEDLSPDSDLDMTGHSAVNDDTRGSLASPDSEASLSSLASLSSEESVDSTSGTQSLQALHVRLIQGQKVSYNLRDLGENSSFSTPLLRVIPEFNLTSKNPGASDREEWWIEWLSDRAARYVRRYGSEQIIDVLSLSTATDMSLRNRDSVYLTHGGDIVQMRTLGVVL